MTQPPAGSKIIFNYPNTSNIITDARSYAKDAVEQADALMSKISELAQTRIEIPEVAQVGNGAFDNSELFDLIASLVFPEKPTAELLPQPAGLPEVPDLPEFDKVDDIKVATFNLGTVPTITLPAQPSPLTLQAPTGAPVFTPAVLPVAPSISLPSLPEIRSFEMPNAPSFDIPSFNLAAPAFQIAAPTANFAFAEVAYQSVLLDAVQVKLLNDLQNGGYGIEPGDESKLWARAREREAQGNDQAQAEVQRTFASRGFMVPPGAMFGALEGLVAKSMQAGNSLSRDISLKRADLYVDNRRFTIQQVQALEGVLINQHMAVMERWLNAAKATAQFALDFYRGRLDEQKARLESYQTQAQVYGERIRAQSQKVEVFRALIQAEQAKADIDKSRVDLYRAQLSGNEATVSIYRAQLEAAKTHADIERLKLEAFKTTVEVYVAGVQAKESEFKMYEAGVKGEKAKIEIFAEQVNAFKAQVDSSRVQADVQANRVRSEVEKANVTLRFYESAVQSAKIESDRAVAGAEIALKGYGYDVEAFRANTAMVGEVGRLVSNVQNNHLRLSELTYNTNIKRAELELNKLRAQYDLQIKAGVSGAEIYQRMVTGALSSITSIASLSE